MPGTLCQGEVGTEAGTEGGGANHRKFTVNAKIFDIFCFDQVRLASERRPASHNLLKFTANAVTDQRIEEIGPVSP